MKKSALILCIVCIVLVACGVVLCLVGNAMGDIFESSGKTPDDTVRTVISGNLSTLVIKSESADVTIHGGAESDYIETVGVKSNMLTVKNAGITISDKKDYLSMVYDTVMNFNGLRNIFFPGGNYDGAKKIDIYLSDASTPKQINIELGEGNIEITGLSGSTDYGLRVEGEGSVRMKDVNTSSRLDLYVASGNATLDFVKYTQLSGRIGKGSLFMQTDLLEQNFDLSCKSGQIYICDESQGTGYVLSSGEAPRAEFVVENGNINIRDEKNTENTNN